MDINIWKYFYGKITLELVALYWLQIITSCNYEKQIPSLRSMNHLINWKRHRYLWDWTKIEKYQSRIKGMDCDREHDNVVSRHETM